MKFTAIVSLLAAASIVSGAAIPDPEPQPESTLERRGFFGKGTMYYQKGRPGSCRHVNPDNAVIVALSNYWMKSQSPSPYCGRKIRARNTDNGRRVTATVADTCPSHECEKEHVDFSVGAFKQLTGSGQPDRIRIEWDFV